MSAPGLPQSVLFLCTHNTVRSPMAEAFLKARLGRRIYVDSAGVRRGPADPLSLAVMAELDLDLSRHRPKSIDDLTDDNFDLVVSLSPEAQHRAVEMTRTTACVLEFWRTYDPTLATGHREARLAWYRTVRDALFNRIDQRFQ